MDPEEDVQDFRHSHPRLDPPHRVVFLLRSERAFHRCGSHSGQILSHKVLLPLLLGPFALLNERGMDAVRRTQLTIGVAGIAGIAAYLLHIHSEQPLVHLDAVRDSRPFIEGIERQLLNERYPIHQDVIALGSKLNTLHFLAPHDGPHVRLVHAHDPVRDTLAGIAATEVIVLLAVHRGDDCYCLRLSLVEQSRSGVLTFHLPHLLQYLAQQVQQATGYLSGLALRVLALFPVSQVRLLNIKELRPRTMDVQLTARFAHKLISLLHTFPQQLLVFVG